MLAELPTGIEGAMTDEEGEMEQSSPAEVLGVNGGTVNLPL